MPASIAHRSLRRRGARHAHADDHHQPAAARQSGGLRQRRLLPPDRLCARRDPRPQLPLPARAGDRSGRRCRASATRSRTAGPIEIDIRNHRKDGEPFWNRLLMAPVYDADGGWPISSPARSMSRSSASGWRAGERQCRADGGADEPAARPAGARARAALALRAGRFGTWSLDLPA